jgi:RimJ/RimL family protein N-acetyltransferase
MQSMNRSITTSRGRIILRDASPQDAERYRDLRLFALQESPTAFGSDYETSLNHPMSHWEGRLKADENGLVVFAEQNTQLAGMTGISRRDSSKAKHSAIIWGVYVRPEWRGLHIAGEMIESCCGWGDARGVNIVKLAVVTTNTSAIRCYKRCGFTVYGTEPRAIFHENAYYDEFLMSRYLANP